MSASVRTHARARVTAISRTHAHTHSLTHSPGACVCRAFQCRVGCALQRHAYSAQSALKLTVLSDGSIQVCGVRVRVVCVRVVCVRVVCVRVVCVRVVCVQCVSSRARMFIKLCVYVFVSA